MTKTSDPDACLSQASGGTVAGAPALTTRTLSFRRLWLGLKNGRLPIAAVLLSFILVLSVGSSFLAWGLTYTAATTSSAALTTALQFHILNRILQDVSLRISAAQETTHSHVLNWRRGFLDVTTAPKTSLIPRKNLFSSQYFTTVPGGEMSGAVWEPLPDGTPVWMFWRHFVGNYSVEEVDINGSFIRVRRSTRPTNFTGMPWLTNVDMADPQSKGWTPMFILPGDASGWKSYSEVAVDVNGATVGVQSADVSLAFLRFLLQELSKDIAYENNLYAFENNLYAFEILESGADVIMSTSRTEDDMFYIEDPVTGEQLPATINNLPASQTKLRAIAGFLNRTTPDGSFRSLFPSTSTGTSTTGRSDEITIDGTTYMMQIGQIRMPGVKNMHWSVTMLINRNQLLAELQSSNRRAIGIIVGVVLAGCILAAAYSLLIARALFTITRDLTSLAQFKF
ncbi:hypothetical protein DFS34DRAFT_597201 [Phlyctochytrium arcticum]|nr:hypothetical protein DFS34DRAFT_597201 [Phlyctochytrium arcticum]